jgi:hypothetical protein
MNRREFLTLASTNAVAITLGRCLYGAEPTDDNIKAPVPIKDFISFQKQYPLAPLRGYTFLGTENSREAPIVEFDGTISGSWFNPRRYVPWIEQSVQTDSFKVELVDGYLPAVKYTYHRPESNDTCEMTAFAADKDSAGGICLYVRLAEQPVGKEPVIRYLRLKEESQISRDSFEQQLQIMKNRWIRFFDQAAQIPCEDPILLQACKASIIRALITYTGKHPHYGMRRYRQALHDSFPPTTISLVNCLLDWGHTKMARDYLMYYFDRFVTDEGRFDYYGPSLAEYGQMLRLVWRLVNATSDHQWLDIIQPKFRSICDWLWKEQSESKTGLVAGVPEADTRNEIDIYFHNNAWLWRGLGAIAHTVYGNDLKNRCNHYRKVILKTIDEVTDKTTTPPFIPPVARRITPFETMTQDRFASYTNYRYWLELLSSGILSTKQANDIVNYRMTHKGEICGMTHFQTHADNWPIAEYAAGLLQLGRVNKVRHLLYSHLVGHMTTQTWTAYEQVSVNGKPYRGIKADYCIPSQLVAPRILAWLSLNGQGLL